MAKKSRKKHIKLWVYVKSFFTPIKISEFDHLPNIQQTSYDKYKSTFSDSYPMTLFGTRDDDVRQHNIQEIKIAKLNQDRDAYNKSLTAQHRLMIATLIAAGVALLSGFVAIIVSINQKPPPVIVNPPSIKVETPTPEVLSI